MEEYPVAVSLIIAALTLFVVSLGAMWKLGKTLGTITAMLEEIRASCPVRETKCDERFNRLESVVFLGSKAPDDDQFDDDQMEH